MLYSRYSNPMNLIDRYTKERRLGEFIHRFMEMAYERKKQEAEKDQEWMLWVAYVHSYSDKSFSEWKKAVMKPSAKNGRRKSDDRMSEKDAQDIADRILKKRE